MLYDLSNPLHLQNFSLRCETLKKKSCIVDLTEKKPKRTNQQNRYLHVCLGYFASLTGNTLEYVKHHYFKLHVNPEIFITEIDDRFRGRIKTLKSSKDLTIDEMVLAIERFRNWSAQEADIYIPSADEHELILQMEIEIQRNNEYI